jgi:hypothetical protein
MPNQGALAELDIDATLAEISNGVIARQIAQRYGVTPDAVRKKLYRERPEEYKQAVADQVEHWVFDSAEEMNNLEADPVCIARARARGDFRLKLAGVLNPKFAVKQEITQVNLTVVATEALSVDAGSLLSQVRGVTIDGSAHRMGVTMGVTTIDGDSKPVDNQ